MSNRIPSPLFFIILTVFLFHLLFVGIGIYWNSSSPTSKPRSKMIAQTVRLHSLSSPVIQAPSQVIVESAPEAAIKTPLEKPISTPPPKPIPKKNPSPPQLKAKSSEPVKKPAQEIKKTMDKSAADKKRQNEAIETEKKRQEKMAHAEQKKERERREEFEREKEKALLKKAKETLAKMSEARGKLSSTSTSTFDASSFPKELGQLQIESIPHGTLNKERDAKTEEATYGDEVAYRLKKALKLPDYGAVKIKLTLDRTGKVLKVETLQTESEKNKRYAESKIPTLLFSSFGSQFQGREKNTFIITLQND